MRTVAIAVTVLLLGFVLLGAEVALVTGGLLVISGICGVAFGMLQTRRSEVVLREQSAQRQLSNERLQQTLSARTAERDQLQRALASTGDLVIALDQDARIRYLNPAAERALQSGDRDMEGAPLLEAVEDPDLYDSVRLAITEGMPAVLVVLRAERRFRTVVAPVSSIAERGPWSVVLAMHDLTDLYEAEIARRDFFVNASHELRTPLASISAAAETLEIVSKPQDSERFRAIIQSEAERMGQLVEEMLALARLESGLTEPAMTVVGISPLLEDAVASIRPQAEREGLSLQCVGLNRGPETMIVADPELVERALLNLLHNAVKFTDPGGTIDVLSEASDTDDPAPMVWIRVRDTGIGIETAEQGRIFQRFYRIDRARQSGGGTGLGLAVVRHIAEVHGGTVSLESVPGEGSTFGFSVPLAQQS